MAATNRSKQLKEAKGQATGKSTRAMSQGIGESKLHGGGGEEKDLSGYTVNGEPLPKECWQTFPISLTDQGKAEMARIRAELPVDYSKRARPAQTIYDEAGDDDRKQEIFRDALALDTDGLTISTDPMAPLMERHLPKGHRGIFLSRKVAAERGMTRGVLTYTPVLIPDGNGGMKEVTCGNMFLASVPEELVKKSDRYWAEINRQKQVTVLDKVREQNDRLLDRRDMRGLLRQKGVADSLVGVEEEDREHADQDLLRTIPIDQQSNDNDPVITE